MDTGKPLLIAICGKSACGKDTLLRAFKSSKYGFNAVIGDTTRPPREGEIDHVDYNFISEEEFLSNIAKNRYMEWTSFNGWYYGKRGDEVCGRMNVGVFDAYAICNSLLEYKDDYNIFVIYVTCPWWKRIIRSIRREGKLTFEMVRRIFADQRDFVNFDIWVPFFWGAQHMVFKNSKKDENFDKIIQDVVFTRLSEYYQ